MTARGVTILADPISWHSQRLQAAFSQLGVEPAFAYVTQLQARLGGEDGVWAGSRKLEAPEIILVQNVPGGSLEQVIYRMDVLHQLEDAGVRVINRPGAIEKMVDKYYTSTLLSRAGLRVPQTVVTESMEEAVQAFERLGQDLVVKPLFGSRGVGMVRLTDLDTAHRVFIALEQGRYLYYLQRFIPHSNEDIRLLMVGEACVAAMLRKASGWKTNVSQGAVPVPYDPPDEIIDLGRRAARAVGADYCGVDVMIGEDGLAYVVEVNSMPAWNGLQSVSPVDIAAEIARYCLG
jgi:RimK family alpha-L-glutamate ligase